MIRILLACLLLISSPAWAVTNWNKALPASGDNLTAWPAAVGSQWSIVDTLLSNYRRGEKLIFKNSTTLTVGAGELVVSNSGASTRLFLQDSSNTDITTANLDSGASFSAGTQYYVYAATSSTTAASSTYYISLSSSAPTGPTYYAQLGSFTTDGSANVISNKVYSTVYGPVNADSSGQPPLQGLYDYGTSASASTYKAGGLIVAIGSQSVGASSNQSITNLPFTSSSTYRCIASNANGNTTQNENLSCVNSTGTTATLYNNWPSGSTTIYWTAIGY